MYPDDAAIERLVTAVIVEQHDEWAVAERRYLPIMPKGRLAFVSADPRQLLKGLEPVGSLVRTYVTCYLQVPATGRCDNCDRCLCLEG